MFATDGLPYGSGSRLPDGPQSKRRSWSALLITLTLAYPVAGLAQSSGESVSQPPAIEWWEGAIALGAVSGIMLLDHPVQRFSQDNRSSSGDDVAHAFRHFGQPEVYGTVTLGLVATGLLAGDHEVTRAGGRLAATLLLAGGATTAGKLVLGRPRPSETLDADGFSPFSGQDAMPSGHTTMAFALATALADDIHNRWASVGLYTVATGVGWSRINDNRHWLSDVAAGALVGFTSAKLMDGHWRLFHLHPPQVLLGVNRTEIAWQIPF